MESNESEQKKIKQLEQEIENLSEELMLTYEELGILYDLSQLYVDIDRIDRILNVTLREVEKTIPCRWVSIYLLEDKKLNISCGNGDKELAALTEATETLKSGQPRLVNQYTTDSGKLQNILMLPLISRSKPIGVLQASNKLDGSIFSTKDLKLLRAIANQASVSIHNIQSYQQRLEYEKMLKELQLAHEIQMRLLPAIFPIFEEVEIFARCIPAEAVGGDFFDLVMLADKQIGLIVADVSGHGLSSALTMTNARSMLRSHMLSEPVSPAATLENLNRMIFQDLDGTGNFITMFMGVINRNRMAFTYSNAGHPPPLIFTPNQTEVHSLMATSMPIAIEHNVQFPHQSIPLIRGTTILLYTDGLTETLNSKEEQFGLDRLSNIVHGNHHLAARELVDLILEQVKSFSSSEDFYDDQTLMVVKVR